MKRKFDPAVDRAVFFTQMKHGTAEEHIYLTRLEEKYARGTANRVLNHLKQLGVESYEGYKITRLEHVLQSATFALRDGADDDWIVAALLHDIGDLLAPYNHDKFAAELLRPFIRDEVTWTVAHHADFQLYYYGHFLGWNQNAREQYRDNIYFQSCVDFCERWDQSAFDYNDEILPLSTFEPFVHRVFDRRPYDPSVIQAGIVVGLPPDSRIAPKVASNT